MIAQVLGRLFHLVWLVREEQPKEVRRPEESESSGLLLLGHEYRAGPLRDNWCRCFSSLSESQSFCLCEQALRLVDPVPCLVLVDRLTAERGFVQSSTDLRRKCLTLRGQVGDAALERNIGRIVPYERLGRGREQVHSERTEGCVQLLVDSAELLDRLAIHIQCRRIRLRLEYFGHHAPVELVGVAEAK